LAGQVDADEGQVQMARDTTIGYLPQDGLEHSGLVLFEEVRSALDEITAMEREMKHLERDIAARNDARDLERYSQLQELFHQRGGYTMEAEIGKVLHGLGFAEEDWTKPCEQFSGGWQMRIALARLLLQRPNLLLLDEPTNHLDLPARNWLESYLSQYPFSVVLVSHDRYLIDALATQIWELLPAQESLRDFKGSYSEYKEFLNTRNKPEPLSVGEFSDKPHSDHKKLTQKSLSRNQRQQLQKKIAALEAKVHAAETEKATWEAQLASPPADPRKLQKITDSYVVVSRHLEELLVEWETLAETLHEDDAQSANS